MKFLKYCLLFILCLFFVSCDEQTYLAVKNILKNLPKDYDKIQAISTAEYNKLKDKTEQKKVALNSSSPSASACKTPLSTIIDPTNTQAILAVKNMICSCAPWGTCEAKSCECSTLCPDDFSIFAGEYSNNIRLPENNLSFNNNSKALYNNKEPSDGYCWGLSLVTQKFGKLAKFLPNSPKPFNTEGEERKRSAHYKEIIKNLINNKPVDISGFKNLAEFSADPEILDVLFKISKDEWAQNAMSMQGLRIVASSRPQSPKANEKIFNDIKERMENNQNPNLVFNLKSNSFSAHVITAHTFIDVGNGIFAICTYDSNMTPHSKDPCSTGIIYDKNKNTIVYNFHDPEAKESFVVDVAQFEVGHSENANVVEQVKNLLEKCKSERGCSK